MAKKITNFTILSKLTSNHLGGTLLGVLRYNSGAVESQGEGEVKQRKSPGSTSTGWHLCFL